MTNTVNFDPSLHTEIDADLAESLKAAGAAVNRRVITTTTYFMPKQGGKATVHTPAATMASTLIHDTTPVQQQLKGMAKQLSNYDQIKGHFDYIPHKGQNTDLFVWLPEMGNTLSRQFKYSKFYDLLCATLIPKEAYTRQMIYTMIADHPLFGDHTTVSSRNGMLQEMWERKIAFSVYTSEIKKHGFNIVPCSMNIAGKRFTVRKKTKK